MMREMMNRFDAIALGCALNMRKFYRDTTYEGVPRTYVNPGPSDEEWIEYIPVPEGNPRNVRYVECQKCNQKLLSHNFYGNAVSTEHTYSGPCDGHTVPVTHTTLSSNPLKPGAVGMARDEQ